MNSVSLATLDTATLRRIHAYMVRVGDVYAPEVGRQLAKRTQEDE